MTVTVSDYHGHPGPSYGKVTLSKLEDMVAFDLGNSRQYSIKSHWGYFDVHHSLIESPDEHDWWRYGTQGMSRFAVDDVVENSRNNAGIRSQDWGSGAYAINSSDRVVYGIAKWIRFTLKVGDISHTDSHRIPAIQFRNIKNTRIVIAGESELTVRSTAPTSLDIPYSTTRVITFDDLNRTWFDGDYLTRYTVTSSDESVVTTTISPRDSVQGLTYTRPYKISIRATGAVHTTADITINALDAANNRSSHTVAVNVTNRTQTPGS